MSTRPSPRLVDPKGLERVNALDWTLAALAALALGECALYAVRVRHLRSLSRVAAPDPDRWPRVSVVVPARDEARDIGPALRSRLADDYPDLEIVVVDDRSTDGTGDLARAIAAQDPRVRVERVETLPQGWLGKVHALDVGARSTTGEWLLLSDADVYVVPGAVRRAVAIAESDGLDMLALVPEYTATSFPVAVTWTIFLRLVGVALSPRAIRDPASKAALGSGAFNLVRRSALEGTPGFEWLRLETGDDVALATMIKRHGGRLEVMDGRGCARVEIYRDFGEFAQGIEKNGGTTAAHPVRFTAGILAWLAIEWAPLAAIAAGLIGAVPALVAVGLAAVCALTGASVHALHFNTGRWAHALAWPLGVALLAYGTLRATWLVHHRGGVIWRGTFHPLSQVDEARRFEL